MVEALPTVVLYKVKPFDLWVARRFIKAKYISLVNLLADAEVMPEYLTDHDVSASWPIRPLRWLDDPAERAGRRPRWPTCGDGSPCRAPRTGRPNGSSRSSAAPEPIVRGRTPVPRP